MVGSKVNVKCQLCERRPSWAKVTLYYSRNSHRWSHENPHGTVETNFQLRFSINVWCGMIDDMLIGPVILDDRMTGQNYLDFLQNELPKQLEGLGSCDRASLI